MRKSSYLKILGVALVMVVSIGVAYAALSASLTITTSSVVQSQQTFTHTISCSKTNDIGTSSTGRTCGSVTSSTNGTAAVSIGATTLSKPEDACIYKCTIANTGSIPSKITQIVPSSPTSTSCTVTNASTSASAKMVCGNITYALYSAVSVSGTTITPTNLTVPTAGITLAATSGTKDTYLVVQYTGTSLNSSQVTQSNGKFTFTVVQN